MHTNIVETPAPLRMFLESSLGICRDKYRVSSWLVSPNVTPTLIVQNIIQSSVCIVVEESTMNGFLFICCDKRRYRPPPAPSASSIALSI